jgi:hypothetical protein
MMSKTVSVLAAIVVAGVAQADVITQWDFNNNDTMTSVGAGTASLVGGTTATFAAGGPTDAAVTDRAWNTTTYAAQGVGSGTRGVAFFVDVSNYTNINISFDHRFSNTSNRFADVQVTIDGGITWTSIGGYENTLGGDQWLVRSADLSAVAGVSNNALFGFRVVSVFGPGGSYVASNNSSTYATSGTWRFDYVTVEGTFIPTPGAMGLLAMAGLVAGRRRR